MCSSLESDVQPKKNELYVPTLIGIHDLLAKTMQEGFHIALP